MRTVPCKVCGRPFSGESFPNGHICPSCNKKRAKIYRSAHKGLIDRRCKLTLQQVAQIRKLQKLGQSYRQLAEQFGISNGHVWAIVKRRMWK